MKIATRQKFLATLLQPFFFGHGLTFRAVPVSAGIVAVPDMAALITNLLVTTQLGCPASLNCRHDFSLLGGHGMVLPVFVAIFTENVGDFICWFHTRSSSKESRGLDRFCNISGDA
jgi:hypothetical protein